MLDQSAAHYFASLMPSQDANNSTDKKSFPAGHHYHLKEGAFDQELNKTVEEIIVCTAHFGIYIDTEYSIQWHTVDSHKPPAHCGDVLNQVALLESQSAFITDAKMLKAVRRQIAEGLARCFEGGSEAQAFTLLQEAARTLAARNREMAWKWYFKTAYKVAACCMLLFALVWLLRERVQASIGLTAFEAVLGTLCGSLGALLSATVRANRLVMDANAGERMHQFEGLSRVGAGLIGALFVALAIKGGLVMGGVQFAGSKLALLLTLCTAAGASERLIPSLLEAFEKTVISSHTQSTRSVPEPAYSSGVQATAEVTEKQTASAQNTIAATQTGGTPASES